MPIEMFGMTHPGSVRGNNEDTFALDAELEVAIVADGMGGEAGGEIASAITVESVTAYLRNPQEPGLSAGEQIKEAVRATNRGVWEEAQRRPEYNGMGSTVVIACWRDGRLHIVNVGDSRAYLWREGTLRQLSYDQNVGNDLRSTLGLTEEQVRKYPLRNVLTMAIGAAPEVLVRERQEEWMAGDVVLLCTDGLHGPVADTEIAAILSENGPVRDKVERLIEAANRAGGPDNITAALVHHRQG